jgi:hypothetical protein
VKSTIFWDITSCSPLKVNWRFGGTYRLHFQSRKISQAKTRMKAGGNQSCFSAYSLTLKMEAICYSETSVDSRQTARRFMPEDGTLHNHRCENLRSYIRNLCSSFKERDHILEWDQLFLNLFMLWRVETKYQKCLVGTALQGEVASESSQQLALHLWPLSQYAHKPVRCDGARIGVKHRNSNLDRGV